MEPCKVGGVQPGSGEFGVEPAGTTKIQEGRTGGRGLEGVEDGEQEEEEGDQAAQRAVTRANLGRI